MLCISSVQAADALVQGQGLSMQLLQQYMEWNAEAVERCKVLYAGEAQAEHVCLLFCSLGSNYDAAPGCLLQQVRRLSQQLAG